MDRLLAPLLEVAHHILGMAWKMAWALVLGFALSAGIQVFVRRRTIARHLGEARPGPLALATAFGAASSSCSYAAAAMSKTLFRRGAHLVNATAFLFASTNLVIEIGLVIWMLLGWRFVLAELVGGVLLIVVVALLLGALFPRGLTEQARSHLGDTSEEESQDSARSLRELLSREGWRAVGRTFRRDWSMVGRDIALGVAIAGAIAAWVPRAVWQTLFVGGEGPGAALVHVVVGPLISVVSFVCSVGNIPLAAVLWQNGLSFAGVVAFIFADLITIPMLLVYRRYYGWGLAFAYAGFLLAAIVVSALAVEAGFGALGLVPPHPAADASVGGEGYFAWDYTAALNAVFLPLGLALAALGRDASASD